MTRRTSDLLAGLVILLALLYAWQVRHVQDDAYITFRFSQNLVAGDGPVWNPGERVEGYSNFLWMALMALPHTFGVDPVLPSLLLGLGFLGLNLWLCWRLALDLFSESLFAWMAFLCIAANYTLLAFGTSGLETAMNGCLWTAAILLAVGRWRKPEFDLKRDLILGVILGLALLTRPDGLLLAVIVLGFLLPAAYRAKSLNRGMLLALCGPLLVMAGSWTLWRLGYYGDVLPNTFYAKAGSLHLVPGLLYLAMFFVSYLLVLPLLIFVPWLPRIYRKMTGPWRLLLALCGLWCLYMVYIGGDFMEFRMLVPVLPLLYLLVFGALQACQFIPVARYGSFFLLLLAGLLHGPTYGHLFYTGYVFPVHRSYPADAPPRLTFADQGKALRQAFADRPSTRFAVGNAGALPYYAGFHFTDLFGLTDRTIARDGLRINYGPGHRRLATLRQLIDKGVDIILLRCDHQSAHPDLSTVDDNHQIFNDLTRHYDPQPGDPALHLAQFRLGEAYVMTCVTLRLEESESPIPAEIKW